jgi:hypothetical protein
MGAGTPALPMTLVLRRWIGPGGWATQPIRRIPRCGGKYNSRRVYGSSLTHTGCAPDV